MSCLRAGVHFLSPMPAPARCTTASTPSSPASSMVPAAGSQRTSSEPSGSLAHQTDHAMAVGPETREERGADQTVSTGDEHIHRRTVPRSPSAHSVRSARDVGLLRRAQQFLRVRVDEEPGSTRRVRRTGPRGHERAVVGIQRSNLLRRERDRRAEQEAERRTAGRVAGQCGDGRVDRGGADAAERVAVLVGDECDGTSGVVCRRGADGGAIPLLTHRLRWWNAASRT